MKSFKALKYIGGLVIPLVTSISIFAGGFYTYFALVFSFGFLPLLELVLPKSKQNMDAVEETLAKQDKLYDWMVYLIVPVQYYLLISFLYVVTYTPLATFEIIGLISAMGVACGVLGINVGHELGHRRNKHEQIMAKMLLCTSLYGHFFIEHNRGHHLRVSTNEDPATSRYGEPIYTFWFRSTIMGYISAWQLENQRLKKLGLPIFTLKNEMLRLQLIQAFMLVCIGLIFSWTSVIYFVLAATFGFLLLESVNYIEHYGLSRKKNANGSYEKTKPHHSWNSNHPIGRLLLFELTRHSDHHYNASRKYQILRHFDESPQLPTGYPGMVLLALVPPLWFWVMHKEIKKLQQS